MESEKYPPAEEYYCKKCKNTFVPAYFPILCTACGSEKVVTKKSLKIPDRDWKNDSSYLDYISKNKKRNST